ETFASLLTVSVQPLVAGFPTDAITLAQLRKAHRFFLRQSHKLLAQRHETNHSPRHKLSPLSISGRTMPLVTEKVLPMSLVHLLPMSPVYTRWFSGGNGYLARTPGKNFVGIQDDWIAFFLELIGTWRRGR